MLFDQIASNKESGSPYYCFHTLAVRRPLAISGWAPRGWRHPELLVGIYAFSMIFVEQVKLWMNGAREVIEALNSTTLCRIWL